MYYGSKEETCRNMLCELEQALGCETSACSKWLMIISNLCNKLKQNPIDVRQEYLEKPEPIDLTTAICESYKTAMSCYGLEFARIHYENQQLIIMPEEIIRACEFLYLGGKVEDVGPLANMGVLSDFASSLFGPQCIENAVNYLACGNSIFRIFDHLIDRAEESEEPLIAAPETAPREDYSCRIASDLPDCIRAFMKLEKELNGKKDLFPEWIRVSFELNQDMTEPPIEVVNGICEAMREVAQKFGLHIAKELYDERAIIIDTEILAAGEYLHFGGHMAGAEALAHHGVFLEIHQYSYEARLALVHHINTGGSVEDAFKVLNQASEDLSPEQKVPTMT